MCETKDEAGTKIDRLIASMDRLAGALEGRAQNISEAADLVMVTVSNGLTDGAFDAQMHGTFGRPRIDALVGPADG